MQFDPDLAEQLAKACIDPNEEYGRIVQDPAGYFWGSQRAALTRYLNPSMIVELAQHVRELHAALERIAASEPRPLRDGHYDADVHQSMQRTARLALKLDKEG